VLRLPAFDRGGVRTSNMGGSVLAIPAQCPNKEAAWAFIEYALCTREAQVAQYVSFDLFPAFLPALSDPAFQEPDAFYGGQPVRSLFAAGVRDIPALNRTSDWVEAGTYINQAFTSWAADREDSRRALTALAEKLSRRLGREVAR
jgi:lactose/L-arabinose transport system substrate-binding protein